MNEEQLKSSEFLELKGMLMQQQTLLMMLIPAQASISRLVELTGKSRQAIRKYLITHFESEVDFWEKSGKIFVSREVAVQIIARGAK